MGLAELGHKIASRFRPVKPVQPLEMLPGSPDLFRAYRYFLGHPQLTRQPGGWTYKNAFYPDYLTVGGASLAIARTALLYCKGTGVDVGAGFWPLPGAAPVDPFRGPGEMRKISDYQAGSQDYLFSSHCLEHIAEWKATLREWVGKVRPGGIVFLYLPHPDCGIWEPGSPMVGDGHVWAPDPAVIKRELQNLGCSLVQCDDGPDMMHSFYVCARKAG